MQKTGWTNYSSFLVWSGLEKCFTYGCEPYGWGSEQGGRVTANQLNGQLGDPSASCS